jgi:hypothetical protein
MTQNKHFHSKMEGWKHRRRGGTKARPKPSRANIKSGNSMPGIWDLGWQDVFTALFTSWLFEAGPHYVAQAGLEFIIFLSQSSTC